MRRPVALERVVRSVRPADPAAEPSAYLTREWLVTNGIGGYASGTVAGIPTRRYHGYLVAALPNPLGRTLMLGAVRARVAGADGIAVPLEGDETVERGLSLPDAARLAEFRLEAGLPVWRFDVCGHTLERRVFLPAGQNTVFITWRLLAGAGPLRLELKPDFHFRSHDGPVGMPTDATYSMTATDGVYGISAGTAYPALRLRVDGGGAVLTAAPARLPDQRYRVEADRGYDHLGTAWTPGHFTLELTADAVATLVASVEPLDVMLALSADDALAAERERRRRLLEAADESAREGVGAELVLAADQFIVTPVGRVADVARARAAGDDVRTVIAGYHWFTDWGRDTMISLEGLTLATGRHAEAGFILRTFGHYVRDGLIPNMFPEGEREGLYHTADASLWYFHAVDRYVEASGDRDTLRLLLPTLTSIARAHIAGTHFGIGVDAADGLLRQGAAGYQLTWMDAKVGDWVVTPRRGKAVELNALWYNALRLLAEWTRTDGGDEAAAPFVAQAARARTSFNRRFWYEPGGHLYDVVDGEDGDDASCRPNQVLAISLRHPVLDAERWHSVVDVVSRRLVTPYGLRSLDPAHPDYKARYFGDLHARDAAYHQGTVWGWLIGPWIDAWLRVHPDDRAGARALVQAQCAALGEFGVGSIAEIFDAEPPFTPRGCVAQAWSVAEALRCWTSTA